jgi:hypothetical protein
MPSTPSRSIRFLMVRASYFCTGCGLLFCEYRNADNDADVRPLLGDLCVLTKPAGFPAGGSHLLPTLEPPRPPPPIELERGTILRVFHVEHWVGPVDPTGTIVFAEVQNGRFRGRRVELGIKMHTFDFRQIPFVLSFDDPGRSLRPLREEDEGIFYAADNVRGMPDRITLLRFEPHTSATQPKE